MSNMIHWQEIDRLVLAHFKEVPSSSVEALSRFLRKWFCMKYNLPFKDPIVDLYSLDELAYEYLTFHYLLPKNDPIKKAEEDKQKEADELWIKQMIDSEAAKSIVPVEKPKKKTKKKNKATKVNDLDIPDNISTKFNID